jgi:pyruvate/2-oxoglutarate/acetoin dehydrogenase E1 component
MVIRTQFGSGRSSGSQHSQSLEVLLAHIPGLRVVMPATSADAYGLLRSSIDEEGPVVFIEHRLLYERESPGPLPGERVPLGKARIARPGTDATIVAWSRMVGDALSAADILAAEGIDVEVIDLRSLHPYDWAAIATSIKKTGRAVFVNEDTEVTNFGEHLIRRAVEELWDALVTPPVLDAGKHLPGVGLADNLENASVPGLESVKDAIRRARTGPGRRADVPRDRAQSQRFAFTRVDFDPGAGPLARETFAAMERAHRHR